MIFWIVFLAFVVFPLLYWWRHAVVPVDGDSILQYWDYTRFSLRSMVTLAYSDLLPSRVVGEVLVFFQGGLGVGGFALFIYTLGRRVAGY